MNTAHFVSTPRVSGTRSAIPPEFTAQQAIHPSAGGNSCKNFLVNTAHFVSTPRVSGTRSAIPPEFTAQQAIHPSAGGNSCKNFLVNTAHFVSTTRVSGIRPAILPEFKSSLKLCVNQPSGNPRVAKGCLASLTCQSVQVDRSCQGYAKRTSKRFP